ncbi:MAG: riboflavin synthase, partial [Planctomycetota bacterium]
LCSVKSVKTVSGGIEICIDLGDLADSVQTGDSIAVNGACLTAVRSEGKMVSFDISGETLQKTTLGQFRTGSEVNIELSLTGKDRIGGHFVQGHVDGVAVLKSIEKKGRFWDMRFTASSELLSEMVVKGSAAVDGISLTVVDIKEDSFSVALIPETMARTTLGKAKIGQKVNIETDVIVKAVKRQLEQMLGKKGKLTMESLRQMGF